MSKEISRLFEKYKIKTLNDCINATKEVLQQVILIGLAKSDFFDNAYFYGGTCLRILYGLKRFSEDLDFTISKEIKKEEFEVYLIFAIREIESYGINVSYSLKNKIVSTSVISSFISINAREFFHNFFPIFEKQVDKDRLIKIKVEIEDNFINNGNKIYKKLNNYEPESIATYDLSTLFAAKLLALLFRNWGNRVKGRDYYDYIFFINNNVTLNVDYFNDSLSKNNYPYQNLKINEIKELLIKKFENTDYKKVLEDVSDFTNSSDEFIQLLNKDYLLSTVNKLKESRSN